MFFQQPQTKFCSQKKRCVFDIIIYICVKKYLYKSNNKYLYVKLLPTKKTINIFVFLQ